MTTNKMIKPPQSFELIPLSDQVVFLAGTIEQGNSEDWQSRVGQHIIDNYSSWVLNPRRDGWDPTWEQTIDNPQFKQQVVWELDGLDRANIIIVNLLADSKSPISLMELGLHAPRRILMFVACEPGFWRRGNVQVLCERYHIPLYDNVDLLLESNKQYFRPMENK